MKKSYSFDKINSVKTRKNVKFSNEVDDSDSDDERDNKQDEKKGLLENLKSKLPTPPGSRKTSQARFSSTSINDSDFNLNVIENSNSYAEGLFHDDDQCISNNYESLDYEKIYNLIDVNEENTNSVSRKQMARWVVMLLVGIFTGLIAVVVDFLVEKISSFKYSLIASKIGDCTSERCLWQPLLLWIGLNSGLSFLAVAMVVFFAPASRGSGIPMVKCYLNGIKIPKVVRIKTLISKMFGVALSVSGGLACGKEGPMIHSGAIVAAGISQGLSTSMGFDLGIFKYFRSDKEKRDFVSGGAAAGVAAAFGAPVGGVLFSLEEGASFWNQSLTWRIFFGSMVSTFTLNIFLSLVRGNFGDLSNPGLINFGKFSNVTYQWYELPIFILMGAFAGLLGALFNHINIKLTKFRNAYVKKKFSTIAECLLVASMSAVIGFGLSYIFSSDCQPIGRDLVSKYPVQLFCDDGYYNAMSGLFFQTPEQSVRSLFHDPPGSFNPVTLSVFCVAYYILAVWTYGLAIPSGLFIPSLLIGAAWGRLVGIGLANLFPDNNVDPGKYALIGAAATLGGILRMTLSLTVIVTEATGDISLGLPIMFSMMAAKFMGDFFNEGIFDMHIELSGIPLLDWDPPPTTEKLNIQHAMTFPVVVLREVENVGRIYEILTNTRHNGYPVVEDYDPALPNQEKFGILKGFILRHELKTLLKKKCFLNNDVKLKPEDFREFYPRYLQLDQVSITEEDRNYDLDLRSYMNLSPYSLNDNSNLPRVFRLFRGLGLRHIVIVDAHNYVVGIVTRVDIARYKAHVGFKNTFIKELNVTT